MIPLYLTVFVCLALTVSGSDEKRAQSCNFIASASNAQTWPKECASAPEGAQCLNVAGGSCGCTESGDCYVNSKSPFCLTSTGVCNPCYTSTGNAATVENTDHYWCRESRFPSRYVASSTIGPDVNIASEYVAPLQFYREVCFTDGSCARCDQANAASSGITSLTFPAFGFTAQSSKDAAYGTVFCNWIRGNGVLTQTTPTSKAGRPICAAAAMWNDVGLKAKVNADFITAQMDVAWLGDAGPIANGTTGKYIGSTPPTSSTPTQGTFVTQPMNNWEGACVPCALFDSSAGGDPTKVSQVATPFNYLCSRALATSPICDSTASVGCRACRTNAECSQSATCGTDGTASCTGGANCQADGSCRTCASASDCGSLDGGEVKGQTTCTNGICTSPFLCNGNFGQSVTQPCPTSALPNCNVDGSCIRCAANANCGSTDLNFQQVCNTGSGVCVSCQVNSDCVGTTGANCMADGSCKDCSSSLCTASLDGGLPANGQPGGCASSGGFCADRNGQVVCNSANRLCEDPCLGNNWCSGRSGLVTLGGGPNCQLSGLCINCGTQLTSSPNCVNVDGPLLTLAGASGTPNQPTCGPNGICVSPFQCTTNPSCVGQSGGANCQKDGTCVNCAVGYDPTTSTCSNFDGGEVQNQPNCNQASRLCVAACNINADCVGTQGANCMLNGLCLSCRTQADCAASAIWGGDGGEIKGQIICGSAGICTSACNGNFGDAVSNPCTSSAPNCHASGLCVACTTDADCAANDGPPGTARKNTICNQNTKICSDPFSCGTTPATSLDNAACITNYGGKQNNCMQDGTCQSCTSNTQCLSIDGGTVPKQPRCDPISQTCGPCQSNSDCPSTSPNCNLDGFCYDCRTFTTSGCPVLDGPPGTAKANQNCDSLTGICVDFCTADSQCATADSCYPKCQLERGCCVECLTNTDCPVPQWRGNERATKTYCDGPNGWICTPQPSTLTPSTPTVGCFYDSDCSSTSGLPACSTTQGVCVACLFDSHCSSPTPACNTAMQKCVGCTLDSHCGSGFFCGSSGVCQTQVIFAGNGFALSAGFLPLIALIFALFN